MFGSVNEPLKWTSWNWPLNIVDGSVMEVACIDVIRPRWRNTCGERLEQPLPGLGQVGFENALVGIDRRVGEADDRAAISDEKITVAGALLPSWLMTKSLVVLKTFPLERGGGRDARGSGDGDRSTDDLPKGAVLRRQSAGVVRHAELALGVLRHAPGVLQDRVEGESQSPDVRDQGGLDVTDARVEQTALIQPIEGRHEPPTSNVALQAAILPKDA